MMMKYVEWMCRSRWRKTCGRGRCAEELVKPHIQRGTEINFVKEVRNLSEGREDELTYPFL